MTCSDENYLIIKDTRIKLNSARNHSVNPSYAPGEAISQQADWSKIVFNKVAYLSVDFEISPSGKGADVSQYYLVEDAFNTSTPKINYYFFNREIMPTTAIN